MVLQLIHIEDEDILLHGSLVLLQMLRASQAVLAHLSIITAGD